MGDFWNRSSYWRTVAGIMLTLLSPPAITAVKSSSTVLLGELGGIITAIRKRLREEDLLALENHTIFSVCINLYTFHFWYVSKSLTIC